MPPLPTTLLSCKRPRQHHERQHRHRRRLEPDDLRADVGEVLGAGRLELARRADLVGRVAGQHLVDGGGVVEQADRRVAHRADHRDLVVDLGELRQQLGELDAGHLGVDRLEDAADVVGDVVLGVPQVEVAGAALEVEQDDALGLAEAGAAVGRFLGGAAFWRPKRLARLKPKTAEPPTRSSSRRVTPSQVSFPARPGITSMVGPRKVGTRRVSAGRRWGGDPHYAL